MAEFPHKSLPNGRALRRNLVFTSVGDRSNIDGWFRGRNGFDLWIAYYGDDPNVATRLADRADLFYTRKGSKFGNLKFAYETWPEVVAQYDAVFVMDDDVLISGRAIAQLFAWQRKLDLWLLQPAFSRLGKISWPITRAQRRCVLRFTNFVEMTCPLFRRDKLDAFMDVFDPILTGTGTDWWFMEALGGDIDGRVAVIDAITCINPHDRTKGGVREIDRLESEEQRETVWNVIKQRHGLTRKAHREISRVLKPVPMRWLSPILHAPIDGYVYARGVAKRVKIAIGARDAAR